MALSGFNLPEKSSNYYELLGLSPFEVDAQLIESSVRSMMREARKYQVGQYADQAEKCLDLLASARGCLLDSEQRRKYDAALREQLGLPPAPELASTAGVTSAAPAAVDPGQTAAAPVAVMEPAAAPPSIVGVPSTAAASVESVLRPRKIAVVAAIVVGFVVGLWFVGAVSRRPEPVASDLDSDSDEAVAEGDADESPADDENLSARSSEKITVSIAQPEDRSTDGAENSSQAGVASPSPSNRNARLKPAAAPQDGLAPDRNALAVAIGGGRPGRTPAAATPPRGASPDPMPARQATPPSMPAGQTPPPSDPAAEKPVDDKSDEMKKPMPGDQSPSKPPPSKPPKIRFEFDPNPKRPGSDSDSVSDTDLSKADVLRELKALRINYNRMGSKRDNGSLTWMRAQRLVRYGYSTFADDPRFQKQLEHETQALKKMFPRLRDSLKDLSGNAR